MSDNQQSNIDTPQSKIENRKSKIIWLQGPSGAGKTTVGRELAVLCNLPFIDLDEAIEQEQGRSITDIFRSDGEQAFRRMEWTMLRTIMDRDGSPTVIALGGGAVINPAIRTMMKETGLRIFLDIRPEQALGRLASDSPRPLLYEHDPAAAWNNLYNQRRRFYVDADIVVDAGRSPAEVASEIYNALPALTDIQWSYRSELAGESCTVRSYYSLAALMTGLNEITEGCQRCIIVDKNIADYYSDYFVDDDQRGWALILAIDSGESQKNMMVVEELAAKLAAAGYTRECVIIGVGGGVVTDLTGFLASIYMRGVRAIYIPTTLLAQVDAAIGGKTAVNAAGVRNLIGTIKQPSDVLICSAFLRSLPVRELRSGFVESLKMGIGNSQELADAVERAMPSILAGELPSAIDEVIRLSVRAKLDVVEQDTLDTSVRLSLNFGHTFGHALEAAEPGEYAHGEAVAFGLIAAANMAYTLGSISERRCAWIIECSLPFTHMGPEYHNIEELLRAMASDKKRAGAGYRFVLPTEGTGVEIRTIHEQEQIIAAMERAFARIADYHQRA